MDKSEILQSLNYIKNCEIKKISFEQFIILRIYFKYIIIQLAESNNQLNILKEYWNEIKDTPIGWLHALQLIYLSSKQVTDIFMISENIIQSDGIGAYCKYSIIDAIEDIFNQMNIYDDRLESQIYNLEEIYNINNDPLYYHDLIDNNGSKKEYELLREYLRNRFANIIVRVNPYKPDIIVKEIPQPAL